MTWHISIGRKRGYTGSRRGRNHRRSGWWDFLCSSSINTQERTFAGRTKSRTKRLTVRRAGKVCLCADRGWIWPRLALAGHATACTGARAAKRPRALPDTGTPRHSAASRGERARARADPGAGELGHRRGHTRAGAGRPRQPCTPTRASSATGEAARPSAATAWARRAPSRAGSQSLAG